MSEWIDRSDRLSHLFESAPSVMGLDTEFMRTDTYAPKLALVQLIIDTHIALIDPLVDIDFKPLANYLSDPGVLCIMHSASEDLEALALLVPQGLGQLFDTQIAAVFAGLGAGVGYQKLVFEITGIALEKGQTRSDWLQR